MTSWIDSLVSPHTKGQIAFTGELEFAAASEDDRTGRTVRFRLVRRPEDMLAAHPFSKYTRRRRGHAGTRFESVLTEVDGDLQVSCEMMLLNWADGPQGATVVFLLDYALDDHPFMSCTRHTKDAAGTRFMAVLLEVDDDNTIVDQEKRERVESRYKQTLSNAAAVMTKNPRFHTWLREVQEDREWDAALADAWLKETIGIESKTELDREDGESVRAIAAFHKLRNAFLDWQVAEGYSITP